jgi:hypothetical protein
MIKFLKFLWKKCFGGIGDSRTKTEAEVVQHTSTAMPVVIHQPRPLHCPAHSRFKKSCPNCLAVVGVK